MRISFDLDDTLICDRRYVPCEPNRVPFFLKPWINEPLRLGTRELIQELQQYGHEISIYTTSYRSPCYVRLWLLCYGIKVVEIINQNIHNKYLRSHPGYSLPSKNPRAFGIDLHVDDSEGVKLEGKKYGFKVVVIAPDDLSWNLAVLKAISRR